MESIDLKPYRKKPKMDMLSYEIVEISVPHSPTEARKKDFDWLVSHAINDEDVPMWVQYTRKNVHKVMFFLSRMSCACQITTTLSPVSMKLRIQ